MDIQEVLECLKSKSQCHFEVDEYRSNNEYTVVRAPIRTKPEADAFLAEIEDVTTTRFLYGYCKRNLTRWLFHKRWVCQHSTFNKKKGGSKRNANCTAYIDMRIKKVSRNTIRFDPYLKGANPLQCVIKLNLNHSHSTSTPDMLRMSRVSSKVKNQFEEYFNSGMTLPEARQLHEIKVVAEGSSALLLNAAYNPIPNQAYYLHQKWREGKNDQPCDEYEKLLEKLQLYESEEVTVKYDGQQWPVLVVTPLMKRAQSLPTSQEIIFLYSSSGCKNSSYTVTMLLTATKAGAIPIAVILHKYLTTEGYQNAFALLKETFPSCFGGKEAPDIFMTDDSTVVKNALKIVWGSSRQLLSHFHVGHTEWRWLMSADSGVEIDECDYALKLFEAVMFADNGLKLQVAKECILMLDDKFPTFVTRFENFFKRKEEWVLFYRPDCVTQNNNTYNFCEATVRILKDVILNKTKAFKIIALVEFCISVFDVYLSKILVDHAENQILQHDIMYKSLSSKMTETLVADIQQVDEHTYLVPSSTQKNCRYIVETEPGYCTCSSSKYGAFCEHQRSLLEQSKLHLPDSPVLSALDCYNLKKLALGDKCPENQTSPLRFLDFSVNKEMDIDNNISIEHNEETEINKVNFDSIQHTKCTSGIKIADPIQHTKCTSGIKIADPIQHTKCISGIKIVNPIQHTKCTSAIKIATQAVKSNFLKEIKRLAEFDVDSAELAKFTNYLSKITNSTQLNEALSCINSILTQREKESNVQLSATSRSGLARMS